MANALDPTAMSRDQLLAELRSGSGESDPTTMSREDLLAELRGPKTTAVQPSPNQPEDAFDMRPLLKTAVSNLPAAGGIVGGIAGAAAGGGLASIGTGALGAGAGTAAGIQARDKINSWVFGEKYDPNKTADDMAKEGGISAVSQAIGGVVTKVGGAVAGKIAKAVIPTSVLNRYQQAADVVKELIGSSDGDIAEAADQVKKGITTSLDEFRGNMNTQIANFLKDNTTLVKGDKIIGTLRKYAESLDSDLYPEEQAQVTGLIEKIGKKVDQNGDMLVGDANAVKQFLQDKATAAYRSAGESGGGTELAEAAKQGAAIARKAVNEAVPEVAEANQKLASLHYIEDRMNKNLIRVGKSESGLIAAGKYTPGEAGGNATYAKALRQLGDITGQDFLGKAQDLAAMKTFSGLSPMSALKNAGAGAAAGGAIGAATGGAVGGWSGAKYGGMAGATLGGALTSPYAIKTAIDAGRIFPPGTGAAAGQALGQAVMHGTGAADSLRQVGGGQ